MEFKKAKNYITDKAAKLYACGSELEKAISAKDINELIEVVRNNADWCTENEFLTDKKSLDLFGFTLSNLFNSGHRNSGDSNSGNWNSGNWNSGDRNSGDSNSGYRNSGHRNSGAFCLDKNPILYLFDNPTKMTVRQWESHDAYKMMLNLNNNIWIKSEEMTAKEKKDFPGHETTGGYLKTISLKDVWANFWGDLTDDRKQIFLDLPNFDSKIFKEITGINTKK